MNYINDVFSMHKFILCLRLKSFYDQLEVIQKTPNLTQEQITELDSIKKTVENDCHVLKIEGLN